jgi:hypothetical protein
VEGTPKTAPRSAIFCLQFTGTSMHSGIFSWDAFSKWEAEAHALIGDFPTYQTTEPSIEAYVKALVADSYRYPKPDGSTLADSYTAYITSLSHADKAGQPELRRFGGPFIKSHRCRGKS